MTTLDQHPSGLDVTVTSWDVDANQRLTTTALGRYMQESAEVNAASMGAGLEDLAREGQTWVLYGLLIRIARYPRFRDRISIETWPRELVGRRAMRDFRIRDAAGNVTVETIPLIEQPKGDADAGPVQAEAGARG